MEKVIINSYEEFEKLVGQQIGVSDYVELSQERINLFADATLEIRSGCFVWTEHSSGNYSTLTDQSARCGKS